MPSLNYFPDGEAIREFFEPAVKSPSIPLCKREMTTDSPLWPLARRASDPEGKGELKGIFLKLWLNWGRTIPEIKQKCEDLTMRWEDDLKIRVINYSYNLTLFSAPNPYQAKAQ